MFCKKCGAEIKEGQKFCKKCGTPVSAPAPVAATTPELAPEPEPIPMQAQEQQVEPAPQPAPQPAPEPTPQLQPTPQPQPAPQPTPQPQPQPAPGPQAANAAQGGTPNGAQTVNINIPNVKNMDTFKLVSLAGLVVTFIGTLLPFLKLDLGSMSSYSSAVSAMGFKMSYNAITLPLGIMLVVTIAAGAFFVIKDMNTPALCVGCFQLGIALGGPLYKTSETSVFEKIISQAMSLAGELSFSASDISQFMKLLALGAGFYIVVIGILAYLAGTVLKMTKGEYKLNIQQQSN